MTAPRTAPATPPAIAPVTGLTPGITAPSTAPPTAPTAAPVAARRAWSLFAYGSCVVAQADSDNVLAAAAAKIRFLIVLTFLNTPRLPCGDKSDLPGVS